MLKVGLSKVDITPRLGTRLGGYGVPERPAESIHDPLYATALVLEQGDLRVVHVTLDLSQIENDDLAAIRRLAFERCGIPADHINIGVIHTHSGPQCFCFEGWGDKECAYVEELIPKVAQAITDAAGKTVPVRVGIATTETKVGINRRSVQKDGSVNFGAGVVEDNPYDSIMTVVRFDGDEGPVASMIHCSAHATAMGNNRMVSRDWPGVMLDRFESQTKAPAIFINGSYGDTGPRTNFLLSPGRFSAGTGDGVDAVNEVGYRGATDALWAHQSIKYFMSELSLDVLVEDIGLPLGALPSLEEAAAKLKEWEARKDEWGAGMCHYRYYQRVVEAHQSEAQTSIPFRQSIITLGPLAMVPFPGEPFSTTTLRLRRYSPFQYTLACGGTNGMYIYLPDRESRHRGGYETWVGIGKMTYLLADTIDDVLVNENVTLLEKLALR